MTLIFNAILLFDGSHSLIFMHFVFLFQLDLNLDFQHGETTT
jgi:hypothetical protein